MFLLEPERVIGDTTYLVSKEPKTSRLLDNAHAPLTTLHLLRPVKDLLHAGKPEIHMLLRGQLDRLLLSRDLGVNSSGERIVSVVGLFQIMCQEQRKGLHVLEGLRCALSRGRG